MITYKEKQNAYESTCIEIAYGTVLSDLNCLLNEKSI